MRKNRQKFDPWDPVRGDRFMCDWADVSDAMGWTSITRLPRGFPKPAIVLFGIKKYWHLGDIRNHLRRAKEEEAPCRRDS